MKQLVLSGFLVAALVLSACERQSTVNSPVVPDNGISMTKVADQMNLSLEQMGQLDEMYYLGEDLSILLTPNQLSLLNTLSTRSGDVNLLADPGDGRIPRGALDMEIMMIYRLILQANPGMTDEEKAALKAAIDASTKTRMEILKDPNTDAETKRRLLQEEHDRLMIEIFGPDGNGGEGTLLRPEYVVAYKELRARLEQERKDQREKWLEARIDRQIQVWTKMLNLTEVQRQQIKEQLLAQAKEIERLRLELKGQPEALREALKQLQDATWKYIYEEIFDQAQRDLWDKIHRRGGTGGTTSGIDREVAYWTKVLSLTPEQAGGLKTILTTQQEEQRKAMTDHRNDPAGLKAELERIKKETDMKLLALFGPEKFAIWVKMHGTGTIGGRG